MAADGKQARLSLFAHSDVRVGEIVKTGRAFFVCPLPPGIDTILGVPWLNDTGTAVSASKLFFVPTGPFEEVYDFEAGRFRDQPVRNIVDLGYSDNKMSGEDLQSFVLCALSAGVSGSLVADLVERIDFEPHNPLLDVVDDLPGADDLSEEVARDKLADLLARFDDVFVDELPGPPPFRPINHPIPLKDEGQKIRPRAIRIPTRYAAQWTAHLRKFVETGFWSPAALDSACAMFAVPKHDRSQARFVINLKPRNDNTIKMTSPIPDMKGVRLRIASKKVRSKMDMKQAYEQIRLEADSVPLSGFVTPNGTFVSHVMQQGDTNAPETMHRVCFMMFSKMIGRFVDVFYDDVLIYSDSRRDHLRHLEIVLTTLRHYRFFISRTKVEFFASTMEVLGAVIDDAGIHVAEDKWDTIRSWPEPKTPKDVLRFMGSLQWMGDHLPRLNESAELAAPLTRLTGKVDWDWSPSAALSFSLLKSLVPETLTPLNLTAIEDGTERLFFFTDASMFGCGGWIGQGATRAEARPFRYFSFKFNGAQRNYSTTDQELLAVFVGIKKNEEHLVGWHFTVVCDHEPLKTWVLQPPKPSRRHVRMWEELARFDFDWEFIPGKNNTLADSLSRLAELEGTDGLSIPFAPEPSPPLDDPTPFPTDLSTRAQVILSSLIASLPDNSAPSPSGAITLAPLSLTPPSLVSALPASFLSSLRSATRRDPLGRKILEVPAAYKGFLVDDGLVFRTDGDSATLVIPAGKYKHDDGRESTFVEAMVERSHELVGHLGAAKTLAYVRRFVWWKTMHADVVAFCRSCEPSGRGKSSSQKPFGFLHALDPPRRCWSRVGMDFVVGLPLSIFDGRPVDSILTVTDYLSKMVVLLPLPSTATAVDVATAFHSGVFRRFGLPGAIVSDRDPKFTSAFWSALNCKIGTSLLMSTAAHPQTDGRAEVMNKTVGQVLRIFYEDQPDDWASKVVAVEFALNSASSSATSLAPFEIVHGFLPTAWPAGAWDVAGSLAVEGFAERSRLVSLQATDAIIAARVDMTHQENRHRRDDVGVFEVGRKAYLSTGGLRFPKGVAAKFVPKFIGPYTVTAAFPSSYSLDLPPHLRIHNKFHASKLRPHLPNDDSRFPHRSSTTSPPPGWPPSYRTVFPQGG
ncbi:hypothetical protein JCM1840_005115 [Sporobolomyces johnsonii]